MLSRARERLKFQSRRTTATDAYGNSQANFVDRFPAYASVRPLRGGSEPVIGARLTGVQPVVIRVRSSSLTRLIATDWRAVDERDASKVYNIRAVSNPDQRNREIEILAEAGVAT